MHIAEIRGTIVAVPVRHRIVSAVREADRVINVLVEVLTDEGESGVSYVAGFTRPMAAAIRALLEHLAAPLRGLDAGAIGTAWDRMWAASTLGGHAGLTVFALSAIDTALWDLQGKRLGAPLHRLLGTRRTTLDAYASDACWLRDDPAQVAAEAAAFVEAGFTAVKLRFGRRDPEDDLAALAAVREAVGDRVRLMVDVNQGWGREGARRYGARLAAWGVEWLEEPLPAEDVEGLAALRRDLPVAITAGENAYMLPGVRALLEAGAVSTLMPDLQRIGGVTDWIPGGGARRSLADADHRAPLPGDQRPPPRRQPDRRAAGVGELGGAVAGGAAGGARRDGHRAGPTGPRHRIRPGRGAALPPGLSEGRKGVKGQRLGLSDESSKARMRPTCRKSVR